MPKHLWLKYQNVYIVAFPARCWCASRLGTAASATRWQARAHVLKWNLCLKVKQYRRAWNCNSIFRVWGGGEGAFYRHVLKKQHRFWYSAVHAVHPITGGLIHSGAKMYTQAWNRTERERKTHTSLYINNCRRTHAHTHFPWHTFPVSVILWLAFPGVALLCMSFSHLPSPRLCATLIWWAESWKERECNQADSWSEAAKQRVVGRQRKKRAVWESVPGPEFLF